MGLGKWFITNWKGQGPLFKNLTMKEKILRNLHKDRENSRYRQILTISRAGNAYYKLRDLGLSKFWIYQTVWSSMLSHMTKDFLANVMVQRIKAPKRNKKPMKTFREKVYEIRIRFSIIWERYRSWKSQIFARNESSRKWMNYSAEIWYPCLQLTSNK